MIQSGQLPTSPREFVKFAAQYGGGECLLWPFAKLPQGYGAIGYPTGRTVTTAHRVVCTLKHGTPEPGDDAAHSPTCVSKLCVNGNHLRWATRSANNEDWGGRAALTSKPRGNAKLSVEAVREVRRGRLSCSDASRKFGVSEHHIKYQVLGGTTWRWLP